MNDWSHRSTAKHLFGNLCACYGSVWWTVLPYCCLNVVLMVMIQHLAQHGVKIAFSIQGHTLMTLLISYLVVAKINISYDRYMKARFAVGIALSRLRELHQMALAYTFAAASTSLSSSGTVQQQQYQHQQTPDRNMVQAWRLELTERIIDLMDCTVRIIRNPSQAQYLARFDDPRPLDDRLVSYQEDDPQLHAQALRLHLCQGRVVISHLEVLERIKLMDMLNDYVASYRELLVLASTPLPFPLLQMARTFLFLWTFSLPFVLRGVVEEALVSYVFVFFLTYGFIGLELVSLRLVHPFGDDSSTNDLNVLGMREATLHGIQKDLELFGESFSLVMVSNRRRLEFSETKVKMISTLPASASLYQATSHKHVTSATATATATTTATIEPCSSTIHRHHHHHHHEGAEDHRHHHHHYMAMGIV